MQAISAAGRAAEGAGGEVTGSQQLLEVAKPVANPSTETLSGEIFPAALALQLSKAQYPTV